MVKKKKQNKVLKLIKKKTYSKKKHVIFSTKLSIGQRLADKVSEVAGSWTFIISFLGLFFVWVCVNIYFIFRWDPYPFILLNLALSTLAALQAPVILMSQNRQAERDRLTAKYDYRVNRKAEREIQDVQKELASIKRLLLKRKK